MKAPARTVHRISTRIARAAARALDGHDRVGAGGIGAPVMIREHSPASIGREAIAPAAIVSITRSRTGLDSLAEATSCARTA